jgi:hypothetical protein
VRNTTGLILDGYQWLPGGKIAAVYFSPNGPDDSDGLPTIADPATGIRRPLTKVASFFTVRTGLEVANGFKSWVPSPRGDWLLFDTYGAKTPGWKAISVDGKRVREWTDSGQSDVSPASVWLPDDHRWVELVSIQGRYVLAIHDVRSPGRRVLPIPPLQPIGLEDPNMRYVVSNHWTIDELLGCSSDGSVIADGCAQGSSALIRIRLGPGPVRCELLSPGNPEAALGQGREVSMSPDGKRLGYWSGRYLWVSNLDGTGERRVTQIDCFPGSLRWQADSRHLSVVAPGDEVLIVVPAGPPPDHGRRGPA